MMKSVFRLLWIIVAVLLLTMCITIVKIHDSTDTDVSVNKEHSANPNIEILNKIDTAKDSAGEKDRH